MTSRETSSAAPIRILWLIKGLGPGGAEHLLMNQARVADHKKFSYSAAYVVEDKDQLVPELEGEGVRVVRLHGGLFASSLRLRSLMKDSDVVHVHSPLLAARARTLRLSLGRKGPKIVSTEHNSWDAYRVPTRLANALTSWSDDARIAVSEAARASMWKPLRTSTEVINHGVNIAVLQQSVTRRDRTRAGLGIDPDALLVVTVANYRVHKDYPNLLAAASQIRDRFGSTVRFVAVGQGPLHDDIHRQHESLQLHDTFTLAGFRPDARDVIAAADVFVLASRHEGRPVALMEALALGRPVVVTNAGGMAEMIEAGGDGIVVPVGDSGALANGISKLVEDDSLRSSFASAAARRGWDFDISATQRRLEEIYSSVAADLKPTAHQ